MIAPAWRVAAISALLVAALALLARDGATITLLAAVGMTLLVAVPVWTSLACLSAFRRAHAATIYVVPGFWLWLAAPHVPRLVIAVPVALAAGAAFVVRAIADGAGAVLWLAAAMALNWPIAALVQRLLQRRLRPFARLPRVLGWTALAVAAVLTLLWGATAALPIPAGYSDTIGAAPRYAGSSLLLGQLTDLAALVSGSTAWAEGWATDRGLPAALLLAWRAVAGFGYFFGLALAAGAPLLASVEARRILAPTDADTPLRPTAMAVAILVACGTVASASVALIAARMEAASIVLAGSAAPDSLPAPGLPGSDVPAAPPGDRPVALAPAPAFPLPSDLRTRIEAEGIGDLTCPAGTIAALSALDAEFAALVAAQHAAVTQAAAQAFDAMRGNVPAFLDWYYSLGAEYLRTLNLLTGNAEAYLRGRLEAELAAGGALDPLDAAMAALAGMPLLAELYAGARDERLARCSDLPADGIAPVLVAQGPTGLLDGIAGDPIDLRMRLFAAGTGGVAAGVLSGVIVAKVAAKLVASTLFKSAAAALAKIAGSKALSVTGGILLGGAAGGTGGSIVPGAGTTAGAILGGIVGGIAVMVGVDFTLLKLDEAVSRDAFAAEILAAIDAAEAEFIAALGPG